MNFYQRQVYVQNIPGNLFDKIPTLFFKPGQEVCPFDEGPLHVLKTVKRKKIKSIGIGTFNAHHTILYCPKHPELKPKKSEELCKIVPQDSNVAYNVIVEVGKLRFLENRQVKEIQLTLLVKHSIELSSSEIENLIDKFIFYLAAIHQKNSNLIKLHIETQGGYILHLDGTCEGDSPKLVSSIDSVSKFVLYSAKLKSENKDDIAEFLKEIKERYGVPLAVVSDMGKGIDTAVKQVFGNTLHYICHFHFLQAVGIMLFEKEHITLRKALSKVAVSGNLKILRRKITASFDQLSMVEIEDFLTKPKKLGKAPLATEISVYYLILWILDNGATGDGYGFPFDQRYLNFYQRLKEAYTMIEEVTPLYSAKNKNDKIIWKLYHTIKEIVEDIPLKETVNVYKEKLSVFSDLREALGTAPESVNNGLTQMEETSSPQELLKIKRAVVNFVDNNLREKIQNSKDKNLRLSFIKVKEKIQKYWGRLFADPLIVNVKGESKQIFVQRTNNIMEQHFRLFNYGFRRIHGNHSVRRNLENIPEQVPLVKNMKNPDYIKLIFRNETRIAEKFSEIDVELIREMAINHKLKGKIYMSRKIKRILRLPDFKKQLTSTFASVAC